MSEGYPPLLAAGRPLASTGRKTVGPAAPAVHVEASDTSGQVLTASVTNAQYATKAIDTHGAWSGTVFTAPVAGVYQYIAVVWNGAGSGRLYLYKNGTSYVSGVYGGSAPSHIIGQVYLAAGDQISFRHDSGYTRSAVAADNYLRITRIG